MATHFIVQPFEQRGRKVVQATPKQEKTEAGALATAQRIADRFLGVVAYAVEVQDDDIGEPRILAKHGNIPGDE